MNVPYKNWLCRAIFSTLLYVGICNGAASKTVHLTDCFEGKYVSIPGLPKAYYPLLFAQWIQCKDSHCTQVGVKLFIGIGIFSGPDAQILETANLVALALVKKCENMQDATKILVNSCFTDKIYHALIAQKVTHEQARHVQLHYKTYLNSYDFVQKPNNILVPRDMECLIAPTAHEVSDTTLQKEVTNIIDATGRLCTKAEITHKTMILIPNLAAYTTYVAQQFATRCQQSK